MQLRVEQTFLRNEPVCIQDTCFALRHCLGWITLLQLVMGLSFFPPLKCSNQNHELVSASHAGSIAVQLNQVDLLLLDTQIYRNREHCWKTEFVHFQFVFKRPLNSSNPGSWLSLINVYYVACLQKHLCISWLQEGVMECLIFPVTL